MKAMKKIFGVTVCSFLMVIFSFSASFGVPLLQLYGEGATYDSGSETWITTESSFTLWVMGNVNGPGGKGSIMDVFLSVAYPTDETGTVSITPTMTSLVTDPSTPDDPIFHSTGDGTNPTMSDGADLPSHGVYGPGTSWDKYSIGNLVSTDSPVADLIDSFPTYPGPLWKYSSGQINAYSVAITGYSWVHFDAFDHIDGTTNAFFAPFSHDAEKVPEPSTLLLLGSGLTVIALWGRRKFKVKS